MSTPDLSREESEFEAWWQDQGVVCVTVADHAAKGAAHDAWLAAWNRARTAAIEEAYEAGRDDGYDLHIHDQDGEYPSCGSDREAFMAKQKVAAIRELGGTKDA